MVRRYDIDRYYTSSHWLVRWVERRRMAELVHLATVCPGERLLEVGCGSGHVLQSFPGGRKVGVDLSATMLARTRGRLGLVPLVRASGDGLPFRTGSFDVVVCTEVLEHVPDPAAVLRELVRVASPHGRVVVSIPNEGAIDRAKRAVGKLPVVRSTLRTLAAPRNEWHLHAFDRSVLGRICAGVARMETCRTIPLPGLPFRYAALLRPLG